MVEKNDILRLKERINTTNARIEKVVKFRQNVLTERIETVNNLVKHLIVMIKEEPTQEQIEKNLAGFKIETQKLLYQTENMQRSYQTLINVFRHPKHISEIVSLYNGLNAEDRSKFYKEIASIQELLGYVIGDMEQGLMPNLQRQLEQLRGFESSNNITNLIYYMQLYRAEKVITKEISEKSFSWAESIEKSAKKMISAAVNAPLEYSEGHKKAVALMILAFGILPALSLVAPLSTLGAVGAFFSAAYSVGKTFLNWKKYAGAIEALLQ